MKKSNSIFFTLLSAFFIVLSTNSYSQCYPDTAFNNVGIYPDYLPESIATMPYHEILTVKIPSDTIVSFPPFIPNDTLIVIDSAGITEIKRLPEGLSYYTNPSSGFIKGGKSGCLLISGTPKANQVGKHELAIVVNIYIDFNNKAIAYPDTFHYSMEILDTSYILKRAYCQPNTKLINSGIDKDTLNQITVGIPFTDIISLKLPMDTVKSFVLSGRNISDTTITVDSLSIDTIVNLPKGIIHQTYPKSGVINGNTSGCIMFSGTAITNKNSQSYISEIHTTTYYYIDYYGLIKSYDTIYLFLETVDTSNNSILDNLHTSLKVFQNSPNPFKENTTFIFSSKNNGEAEILIYSSLGECVHSEHLTYSIGINTINISLSHLPKGIFYYKIIEENLHFQSTNKMIKL